MENVKILCVDDERNVLRALQRLFMDDDYEVFTAENGDAGIELLENEPGVQLVISDYRMPGMDGVDFLKIVNAKWPNTIRIVLSGFADTASVVGAINEGQIYKFIPKPWNDDDLRSTIEKALETFFLRQKNEQLKEELMASNEMLKTVNEKLEELVEKKTEELVFQVSTLQSSQNVFHALPVAVLGLDDSGLIVQSNELAEKLFKGSQPSVILTMASAVLPSEINEVVGAAKERGCANGAYVVGADSYSVRVTKFETSEDQSGVIVVCVPEP